MKHSSIVANNFHQQRHWLPASYSLLDTTHMFIFKALQNEDEIVNGMELEVMHAPPI